MSYWKHYNVSTEKMINKIFSLRSRFLHFHQLISLNIFNIIQNVYHNTSSTQGLGTKDQPSKALKISPDNDNVLLGKKRWIQILFHSNLLWLLARFSEVSQQGSVASEMEDLQSRLFLGYLAQHLQRKHKFKICNYKFVIIIYIIKSRD